MRTLAEEIVANDPTKLPEGETAVTQENYFRIASLERLGLEQPSQFQSHEQDGYLWRSHLNENGEALTGDSSTVNNPSPDNNTARFYNGLWSEHNSRSAMPRSYTYMIYQYYNWYAATAESGTYSMTSGTIAPDSICPQGWQLLNSSGSKSFHNMLDYYGDSFAHRVASGDIYPSSEKTRQRPFSLNLASYYKMSGYFDYGRYGDASWYWANAAYDTNEAYNLSVASDVVSQYCFTKTVGWSVRCVLK